MNDTTLQSILCILPHCRQLTVQHGITWKDRQQIKRCNTGHPKLFEVFKDWLDYSIVGLEVNTTLNPIGYSLLVYKTNKE